MSMETLAVDRPWLMLGDCLERMREIPDGRVDAVICDLPYATTQNSWDSLVPLQDLWSQYQRVVRPDGAIILTAAQPFTSLLVVSQPKLFRYSWIWQKEPSGNLNAKRMPMPEHEDVLVFGKSIRYFPQGLRPTLRKRSAADNSRTTNYGQQKRQSYEQTVTGYPTTILPFAKDRDRYHPTQKPLALIEYLLKTYSNEDETILDNTMGSGTTGVASVNTGRRFIGIERDPHYFDVGRSRIDAAIAATQPAQSGGLFIAQAAE